MEKILLKYHRTIDQKDLQLFKVVDSEQEIVNELIAYHKKYGLSPNF